MESPFPYSSMVTVPHKMIVLERMLDSRSVVLERLHCTSPHISVHMCLQTSYHGLP